MIGKDIQFILSGGETVCFEDAVYSLDFPDADVVTGADGTSAFLVRAGTFAIKIPDFSGWFGAEGVTVDGTYYEVKRNFRIPERDGEWLIYHVSH
ncbi:hypothetical protein LU640_25670 [Pseudomonas monteilii]|jgi:hypothetical protein|uniref:hypothetical protein n=1 Tax=Pseudomonas TaxID=286 RepID=UPI0015FCAD09|nr:MULTISPECIES: hypothetical protein [Pseudomonas]EKT4505465.1 hypothetical protein [Pseudomonas putida]MBA6088443.1 hypothetical protein [Pseudomonas monteilii]MCE1020792.1 hypothetical protein [Pseudomonas monteilii]MCE1038332.1 hypothetical protein [Pseudomonas monteilii]MCE1090015.1 hypothetical protein [Pseudomonas monteilii]